MTTLTFVAGAALLGAGGCAFNGASVANLFTSIVEIQTANPGVPLSGINCNVVNVDTNPRNGTLTTIGGDGTILSAVSYNNLAPGTATGDHVGVLFSTAPATLTYCKITVNPLPGEKPQVTAGAIRGSLDLTDHNGNTVAHAEAR